MRRIFLALTVAALMAAMMVTAGPAKADSGGNSSDFNNDFSVVQINNDFFVFGFDDDDDFGFDDDDDFGGTSISIG